MRAQKPHGKKKGKTPANNQTNRKPYGEMSLKEIKALPEDEQKAAIRELMPAESFKALASVGDKFKAAVQMHEIPVTAINAAAQEIGTEARWKQVQETARRGILLAQEVLKPRLSNYSLLHRITQDIYRENRPEVWLYVEMPKTQDKVEECILLALWPFAKFCKAKVDSYGNQISDVRYLVTEKAECGYIYSGNIEYIPTCLLYDRIPPEERPILDRRFRFWSEEVPAAVRELVAALRAQGRDGPETMKTIFDAVIPHFKKLEPGTGEDWVLVAYEDRLQADALQALRTAANAPAAVLANLPAVSLDAKKGKRCKRPPWTHDERSAAMRFSREMGWGEEPDARSIKGGRKGMYSTFLKYCNANPKESVKMSRVKSAETLSSLFESVRDCLKRSK